VSFLGIDLGTSFIKGAVLDLDARRIRHVHRIPFPDPLPNPNALLCEYDPDEVVKVTENFIKELSTFAPDCSGIVMCTQMHGMVLLSEKGQVRSRCISWRDLRALMPHPSGEGSYFDVYTKRISAEHKRELGNELRPGTPGCFLFWLAEQGKLEPGLIPVSIPDFVLHALGGSAPSVDLTNGMAYGLLNLKNLDWHYPVMEEIGLPRLRWPAVRIHGEVAGQLKTGRNLVPCYTPVGDYQCSVAGTLLTAEELSLNVSTGSQVSRLTPKLDLGDCQSRPFFDGKFLNTFTHIPAGRSLNLLLDLLSELAQGEGISLANPWPYVTEQVSKIERTDLQVGLYFFAGPYGDRGAISNIRGDNFTVGHLFRAAFNNMADTYYQCALRIWPERAWRNLVFSGGLAVKLEVLRQIIQKQFQTDYRLAPCAEDSLLGLLALALAFSGRVKSVEQAMADLRAQEQSYIE
jgi:sugar (pentulose or hexulose) kinase